MRLLLTLSLLALSAAASAQGRMAFGTQDHEMGRLTESEPGTHVFRFVNDGDRPLTLAEVESNCGCTIPAYTSDAVAPGGSGEVTVRYETAGRPGPFESAVRVTSDAGQAVTLRISGVVEPALATTGVRIGNLAFDKTLADLGTIPTQDGFQLAFQFANVGPRPVRIDSVAAPPGVEVVHPQRATFPDGLGGLFVTAAQSRVGRLTTGHGIEVDLVLYTDDAEEPVKTLQVTAQIEVLRARGDGTIHVNGEQD